MKWKLVGGVAGAGGGCRWDQGARHDKLGGTIGDHLGRIKGLCKAVRRREVEASACTKFAGCGVCGTATGRCTRLLNW